MRVLRSNSFLIFIGSILACYAAFANRFPLLYSDMGTYVLSGFQPFIPVDRPIFYGLFLRHVSLATSPWLVILAQGFFVSYVIFRTFDMLYSGIKRNLFFLATIMLLSLTTSLSPNVSVLIPDIFSSIGILSLVNLVLNEKLNRTQRFFLILLFVISMLFHFSNFITYLSLVLLLSFYLLFRKRRKKPDILKLSRLKPVYISILSVIIIVPCVNYAVSKQFVFSRGGHVFFMNHLYETGVLEDYLSCECSKHNYKICNYFGKMPDNFLWDPESPVYKEGGWDSTKEEYDRIIFDILTTPKYEKQVITHSVECTFVELFDFDISKAQTYPDPLPPYTVTRSFFPKYMWLYKHSVQNTTEITFAVTNEIQRVLMFLSFFILLAVIITASLFNALPLQLKWLQLIILVYGFLNAAICSNCSTIDARFQSRIAWLIPLTAILVAEPFVSAYLQKRKSRLL